MIEPFPSAEEIRRSMDSAGSLPLFRPEESVFRSMLGSWAQQMKARGLATSSISDRVNTVRRFRDSADLPPWQWQAIHLDNFTGDLVERGRAKSTIRQMHVSIKLFCEYLTNPAYDWVRVCEALFGETPSQICLPWNTISHLSDYEGRSSKRPLTYDEIDALFEYADSRVEDAVRSRRKGALAAMRDAQMIKTAYAFGLRRAELVGLEAPDLHYSAAFPEWGRYAVLHIRHAKGANGSGPRRRFVQLVPEMEWWVEGMTQWVELACGRFGAPESDWLWPTERGTKVAVSYVDSRFAGLRDGAGLPTELTLHCLRHSYLTHLAHFGYPERFRQEQAGHRTAVTTAKYTNTGADFMNSRMAGGLNRL